MTVLYNLRFPGQYYQAETGLNYNYFRDYDPQVGRYQESDPIGLRGGKNTYTYVADKPIAFTDPLGLAPCYFQGYRRTAWEEVPGSRSTPWYELLQAVVTDNGLSFCLWNKFQAYREQRDVYAVVKCWQCKTNGCPNSYPNCTWQPSETKQAPEQRTGISSSKVTTAGSGFVLNDADPTSPSNWTCVDPNTGGLVGGAVEP